MNRYEIQKFVNDELKFAHVTDSQDLAAILDDLGITQFTGEITGALVNLDAAVNGEITSDDVYLTESNKPWSILAEWDRPAYYADEILEELDLQD